MITLNDNSEYLINNVINNEAINSVNLQHSNDFFFKIFKLLNISKNYIKNNIILSNATHIIQRENVDNKIKNGPFINIKIINFIKNNLKICIHHKFLGINNNYIDIKYYVTKDYKLDKLLNYSYLILLWINFLSQLCKNKNKTINLKLFLTNFKKELPNNNKILGNFEVNSAFTFNCAINSDEYIYIYREEDLFKTIIHETLHYFCVDLKNDNNLIMKIKNIIKIDSDYLYNEAYVEFFARFFNSILTSFIFSTTSYDSNKETKTNNFKDFYNNANILLEIETVYSFFLVKKILNHYNLSFNQLFNKNISIKFKEESNVFSYYILTSLLLFKQKEFIDMLLYNFGFNFIRNSNKINNLFVQFIIHNINDKNYIKIIDKVNINNKSLQMSVYSLE